MEIVRFVDAPIYDPPNHGAVVARRLQGGEASSAGFVLVGHSAFPPGAAVPLEAGPIDKIYVVETGAITIEQADGRRHILEKRDSIFIPAGEARGIFNHGDAPATIIVITALPAK